MARKRIELSYNGSFAKRLRRVLREKDYSQKDIAEACGVSAPTVSYYCNGESSPDILTLARLCEVLGVSADWLLGISDERAVSADLSVRHVSEITGLSSELLESLARLKRLAAKGVTDNATYKNTLEFINMAFNSADGVNRNLIAKLYEYISGESPRANDLRVRLKTARIPENEIEEIEKRVLFEDLVPALNAAREAYQRKQIQEIIDKQIETARQAKRKETK